MIDRLSRRPPRVPAPFAEQRAVAIRRAQDADGALLHELAALDSAAPLRGVVLVAVVDGRIWAALAIDDDRVVADPFLPTAHAVELLRLRVRQLRTAAAGGLRRGRPARRLGRRARA